MSRQSGGSRQHGSQSRNIDGHHEGVIAQVKSIVTQLDGVLSSSPHEWATYVPSARSAMGAIDRIHFFRDRQRFAEQIWVLQGLQDFAYHDPDSGCIRDIAEWCQIAWLRILQDHPENLEALTGGLKLLTGDSAITELDAVTNHLCDIGLGSNWLQMSQATLAQIHRQEGTGVLGQDSDDAAAYPPDPRRQGPLYVEARGYLQPAVDFYARAVQSANARGSTTGGLLASAAESNMSLGNVTAPPGDERHFTQAIHYLRLAEAIPNFLLSTYLQEYLNDYGRYVS
ncbi:uncharacterized protein BP5553_07643 [Venustampulla echinocandica]|uniref:Uncharacterized protein n=1 Tax=Venustampulla echinocandica TaxID=2656787 RepID=A0A370TH39_9HELO|nr:uncharacterized protein BP5553_07643 [Venustampulla echinocandica]RDL34515.1 hypothetical protein BP5553_07643 [Venustampulla echinocandica]